MLLGNLEEDTANYIQYKIMNIQENQKTVLRLKKGILPHKFQCQNNTVPQPSLEESMEMQAYKNRKHLEIIEEALSAPPAKQSFSTPKPSELLHVDHIEASTSSSQKYTEDIEMKNLCEAGCSASLYIENKMYVHKAVQVSSKINNRSKGVNINLCAKKRTIATSPFKISRKTISTSPLKITHTSIKKALFRDDPADTDSISNRYQSFSCNFPIAL